MASQHLRLAASYFLFFLHNVDNFNFISNNKKISSTSKKKPTQKYEKNNSKSIKMDAKILV